jgi:hypothetical protein
MPDCHLKFGGMKQEFRVIVDHYATVKFRIRDELTVCRWGEAYIDGNCSMANILHRF